MTDERRIAICTSYDELIAALRARADELKVTREGLDAVSGLQAGYSAKLLAPVPMRSLGKVSLGPMLQALGLAVVLVEDPEAIRRFADQHAERQRPTPTVGTHEVITIQITRRKLKRMARRGGKKRAAAMTPKQRSRSARKAARALWRKRRAIRRTRKARVQGKAQATLPRVPEPSTVRPQSADTGARKGRALRPSLEPTV